MSYSTAYLNYLRFLLPRMIELPQLIKHLIFGKQVYKLSFVYISIPDNSSKQWEMVLLLFVPVELVLLL